MWPIGQLVGLSTNQSSYISNLLEEEPLMKVGAITNKKWDVYELKIDDDEGLNNPNRELQLFFGLFNNDINSEMIEESKDYHKESGKVYYYADIVNDDEKVVGTMMLFNSKTNLAILLSVSSILISFSCFSFSANLKLSEI